MAKSLPKSITEITGSHAHKQTRGWCIPYLVTLDTVPSLGTGRWDYWLRICDSLELPDDPIPHVHFQAPHELQGQTPAHVQYPSQLPESAEDHIRRILEPYLHKCGKWYDDAWLEFVRWLLHGFGAAGLETDVERTPEEVRDFWYTQFNLAYLLSTPIDWSAYILQSGPRWMGNGTAKWAKSTAFFSTPMNVINLMTAMLITDVDTRVQTVCDPCCGTGSMLLPASNHSLRLYGMDIVYDLVLCTMLNGYLWAPWMVKMPAEVDAMLESLAQAQAPTARIAHLPTAPLRLETRPAQVAATQAYREGSMAQADFFAAMNV